MISMKVIMAGILRKYKFTTELKLSDLIMKFELTLKLANKHLVNMERREWTNVWFPKFIDYFVNGRSLLLFPSIT